MTTNILFIVLSHILSKESTNNLKARNSRIIPYGVLSIASYIKKFATEEIDVKIIDCNLYNYSEYVENIKNVVLNFNPEIVAISMNYDNSYKYLNDVSKVISENMKNDGIVILGGTSASFSYKEILEEQNYIDAICYTEGEIPILQLLECKRNGISRKQLVENHKSFITKESLKNGKFIERTFVKNLDDVINIDYNMIDISYYKMMEAFSPHLYDNVSKKNKKQFFLVTSRGCPYKCVFCATHSGLYADKVRYANVDTIISHVKHLVDVYGMNVLTIYDDQLLMNKVRAKELFRKLADFKLRIECPNGLSVAFIDDEMAYLMKNAGMDTIILAIEHGSEYMLNKIIHKPLSLKIVKPIINILRKYNFFIEAFFIIGIPGEEEKHRTEMIDFIKDVNFDWVGFNPATPLRGSELYNICIKNGYINKNLKIGEIENEMRNYIINAPPHLIPDDIMKKMYLINLDINFVNNYRMKTGDYETAAKCFEDVIERSIDHAFAHYYLALCQFHMNKNQKFLENKTKFDEILNKDKKWSYYSNYFQLSM